MRCVNQHCLLILQEWGDDFVGLLRWITKQSDSVTVAILDKDAEFDLEISSLHNNYVNLCQFRLTRKPRRVVVTDLDEIWWVYQLMYSKNNDNFLSR